MTENQLRGALQGAASSGNIDILKLLLDQEGAIHVVRAASGNPLMGAVTYGKEETVKILLDHQTNPNADGALARAAADGRTTIVKYLLDAGADVNAVHGQETALTEAAMRGYTQVIQLLLDRDAKLNIGGGCGNALLTAIEYRREDAAVQLMNGGADPRTPGALQRAAAQGLARSVTQLLDRGADINAVYGKETALTEAAMRGYTQVIQLLLDRGANIGGSCGNALLTAIEYRREDAAVQLMNGGADPRTPGALQRAAAQGLVKSVTQLLDRGADINAVYGKETALTEAAMRGYTQVIQLLLDRDAKLNIGGGCGNALLTAIEYRREDAAVQLVNGGADPSTPGALQRAAAQGLVRSVTQLLDRGADINAVYGQETALTEAAMRGYTRVIKLLLDRDAKLNIGGGCGNALLTAITYGHEDTAVQLLDSGADPNTPGLLAKAASAGRTKVVQRLLSGQSKSG